MNTISLNLEHPIKLAVVTGASGHLGANLVRVLLALGIHVRAVVHPNRPHPALTELPVEIVEHDVRNPDGWNEVLQNCTHLFHCAALFSFESNQHSNILTTSIDGTRNLLLAASKCPTIERIVYTSSTASIGYSHSPNDILNETDWNDAPDSVYAETKVNSEKIAWELAKVYSLPLIVVNPSVILGYYDFRLTPPMQMVLQPMLRSIPFTIPGGLTIVDATDCAVGHVLAADKGRIGERYILSGERYSIVELNYIICGLIGTMPPRFVLGKTSGEFLSLLLQFGSFISRKPAVLTKKRFRDLYDRYGYYTSEKAKTELGFSFISGKDTVAQAIAWLLIGNAVPVKNLTKMHLREEIINQLPIGWTPGKKIQFQTFPKVRT